MGWTVKQARSSDAPRWDAFVHLHPGATAYHLFGWKKVIEKTYGHKTCYLAAEAESGEVAGVLPLVRIRHFLFGSRLVSMPFLDLGGVLTLEGSVEKDLLEHALVLSKDLGAEQIELRQLHPLLDDGKRSRRAKDPVKEPPVAAVNRDLPALNAFLETRSSKVGMRLELPGTSEALMSSFRSKLRSQIKKPAKEGLYLKSGGRELVDDFYEVFLVNMRDLGSPVHSRELVRAVVDVFETRTRIFIVYLGDRPAACSLVIGLGDTLYNPWASAMRKYSSLSPNMLLYWGMLEYACGSGFKVFEFGRSTPGEGTYRFKEQWGAQPVPLYWHYISWKERKGPPKTESERFQKAAALWRKLPVPVTRIIGPYIRKHIAL